MFNLMVTMPLSYHMSPGASSWIWLLPLASGHCRLWKSAGDGSSDRAYLPMLDWDWVPGLWLQPDPTSRLWAFGKWTRRWGNAYFKINEHIQKMVNVIKYWAYNIKPKMTKIKILYVRICLTFFLYFSIINTKIRKNDLQCLTFCCLYYCVIYRVG